MKWNEFEKLVAEAHAYLYPNLTNKDAQIRKWDLRFLEQAKLVSTWSKDPSTQCGAIIIRPDRSIVSTGYNGFPRKIADSPELYENREEKYKRVIHCEMNAILQAGEKLDGCTLYVYPFLTCERCCVHVIQAGITRVVAPKCPADKEERWGEKFELARKLYREAKIDVTEIEFK